MSDYKSVQYLIVKAAMYDKVSTTISPNELFGGRDVLTITFSKGDRYVDTHIDMYPISNHEAATLYACKSALKKLLWGPYEVIEYAKEDEFYES
jgi:hypothetical protein